MSERYVLYPYLVPEVKNLMGQKHDFLFIFFPSAKQYRNYNIER